MMTKNNKGNKTLCKQTIKQAIDVVRIEGHHVCQELPFFHYALKKNNNLNLPDVLRCIVT